MAGKTLFLFRISTQPDRLITLAWCLCRTSTSLIKPELSFHGNCRLGKSHHHNKFPILNGLCNLMACLNSSKSLPDPGRARAEQPAWAVRMHRGEQTEQAGAAFPQMPCGGREPFRMGHMYSTASMLWPGLRASY